MLPTLTSAGAVDLAVVERSGVVESRHVGAAVVLGPDGEIARALGDTDALLLPRSALKPVQALAALAAGAPLTDEQVGLATASHTGTDRHVEVVRSILHAAGLSEDHLGCPAAWPRDRATRDAMVRDLSPAAPIRMPCSGKHAAMLAACVANAWPLDSYLDPTHPLQTQTRELVERMTGSRVPHVAVDGCGAPVPVVSLTGLARALHRMGTSGERSPFALHRWSATVLRAVRENPWTVEGEGYPDTVTALRTGVFSKFGAEGVLVLVTPDGTTVALKVLDGSRRPALSVGLRLLEERGAVTADDAAATLASLRSPAAPEVVRTTF